MLGLIGRRIVEAEDERARRVMFNSSDLTHVMAMDVAVKGGDVLVGRERVHHRTAVAREPFPLRLEIEQWAMREDDNRRARGKAREVRMQPGALRRADLRTALRNVV